MPPAVGLPSWDSCLISSIDECGRAYLGGAIVLVVLLVGLWLFRDMLLDALSDVWPWMQARLPRRWFVRTDFLPAVLVAGAIDRPARVGRLWYGATLSGSDPPATDRDLAAAGVAAITKRDPSFREATVIDLARRAAPVVMRAWTEQAPRLSRRIMGPVIWEQQKEDIAAYQADGRRNVLEGFAVRGAGVVAAATDGRFDTLVVRLALTAADYDIALATHSLVRGSKSAITWSEDWTFQRAPSGARRHVPPPQSSPPQPISPPPQGARESGSNTPSPLVGEGWVGGTRGRSSCPRCGAPIDLDVAAVCGSCDAELDVPPPSWILSRIDVVPAAAQSQAA